MGIMKNLASFDVISALVAAGGSTAYAATSFGKQDISGPTWTEMSAAIGNIYMVAGKTGLLDKAFGDVMVERLGLAEALKAEGKEYASDLASQIAKPLKGAANGFENTYTNLANNPLARKFLENDPAAKAAAQGMSNSELKFLQRIEKNGYDATAEKFSDNPIEGLYTHLKEDFHISNLRDNSNIDPERLEWARDAKQNDVLSYSGNNRQIKEIYDSEGNLVGRTMSHETLVNPLPPRPQPGGVGGNMIDEELKDPVGTFIRSDEDIFQSFARVDEEIIPKKGYADILYDMAGEIKNKTAGVTKYLKDGVYDAAAGAKNIATDYTVGVGKQMFEDGKKALKNAVDEVFVDGGPGVGAIKKPYREKQFISEKYQLTDAQGNRLCTQRTMVSDNEKVIDEFHYDANGQRTKTTRTVERENVVFQIERTPDGIESIKTCKRQRRENGVLIDQDVRIDGVEVLDGKIQFVQGDDPDRLEKQAIAMEQKRADQKTASDAAKLEEERKAANLKDLREHPKAKMKDVDKEYMKKGYDPAVYILSHFQNVVMVFLGACGWGEPTEADQLTESLNQFSTAYTALSLAAAKSGQWSGDGADSYNNANSDLMSYLANAGVDGMIIVGTRSYATALQKVIESEARSVYTVKYVLTAILDAVIILEGIALIIARRMGELASIKFQISVVLCLAPTATSMFAELIKWSQGYANEISQIGNDCQNLTAQVNALTSKIGN